MMSATHYNADSLLSTLLTGVIAGIVTMVSCVSFSALIFSGDLAPHIATGIAILTSTAVIAGSIISVASAGQPVVAGPDDDTAPVLALMVTLLFAAFPADVSAEVRVVTALAALAIASLLTGAALATLGVFRLGGLVRFLPYSVMGGYFAGVGLLLILGSLRMVTELQMTSLADLGQLFSLSDLALWLPALVAAVIFKLGSARLNVAIAMPVTIFSLIALYFLGNWLLGEPPSQLMTRGLLMGPFPETNPSLFNPVLFRSAADIEWGIIFMNGNGIATIVMLSSISLMLTASGLSLVQRQDIDINRELLVAGTANAVSGVTGGLIALPSLAVSNLAITMGAPRSRLVGLVVAGFCALMLFFALDLIAWLPKAVLAGLLMFLGWSFLERWLIEARTQLPTLEYGVVVVIVMVVAFVGFLEGVFVGLVCAILLFVVNYSRTNVVRYALTGNQLRSNVERNFTESECLRERGDQTLIIKLQGYLFFGTAAALGSRIESRLEEKDEPALRFVAIDFAQVSGMDSSAALSFMKLAQQSIKSDFILLMTSVAEDIEARLKNNWFESDGGSCVRFLPDLDRGIEWIEERILLDAPTESCSASFMEQLSGALPRKDDIDVLKNYLELRRAESGDVLARQGEPSDEMFLLETCSASVYLFTESRGMHRIRRAASGTVFGEVGFYLGTPRTATVTVDQGGKLYALSKVNCQRLESEHPEIASAFHKFMIGVLSRRLQLTTTTLQAVLT